LEQPVLIQCPTSGAVFQALCELQAFAQAIVDVDAFA
jgi:hypothetical protein